MNRSISPSPTNDSIIAWSLSDEITQARDKRSLRRVCDELGIEVAA